MWNTTSHNFSNGSGTDWAAYYAALGYPMHQVKVEKKEEKETQYSVSAGVGTPAYAFPKNTNNESQNEQLISDSQVLENTEVEETVVEEQLLEEKEVEQVESVVDLEEPTIEIAEPVLTETTVKSVKVKKSIEENVVKEENVTKDEKKAKSTSSTNKQKKNAGRKKNA